MAGKLAGCGGINGQRVKPRWGPVDPSAWELLLAVLCFPLLLSLHVFMCCLWLMNQRFEHCSINYEGNCQTAGLWCDWGCSLTDATKAAACGEIAGWPP